MKHKIILRIAQRIACVAAAVSLLGTAMAQNITVTSASGQDIATFVNNNLIGDGVYVWNVKFNNATGNISKPQIGTFNSNGYASLNMDEGVIMTTGNVTVAPGPNNAGGKSESVTGYYTDTYSPFVSLSSNSLYGCSVLDFDFVSISPFVTVTYCFASEEYPEYVCANVNDLFAFIISGPRQQANGTWANETWNAACIPHTIDATHPNGIAVSINTVNQGMAGTSGGGGSGCLYNYSEFYVSNHTAGAGGGPNNQAGIQYDGFTKKLSANATLQPCAQYHMHIAICNVGDNAFDSGVFLEKESFSSPSADVNLSHREATPIQRSNTEIHSLSLAGSSYSEGHVRATFGGTAEVDEDYVCRIHTGMTINNDNREFDITDGNSYLSISPTPTADLTTPKTVNIYLRTSLCTSHPELYTYDTIRYLLVEDNILRLRDTTINAVDTCRAVGVEVAIGEATSFHWLPEDDIDFPNQQYSSALITESRDYRVAAADAEGHVDTAEVHIIVTPHAQDGIEAPQQEPFRVYPNPATGYMNVYMQQPTESDGTLSLIDISGKTLETVDLPAGTIDLTLDLSSYRKAPICSSSSPRAP